MFGSVAGSCLPALQLDWECFRDLWLFRSEPQSLSRDLLAPGSWNIFQVRFCMWTRERSCAPKNSFCFLTTHNFFSTTWAQIKFFCYFPLPEPKKSVTWAPKILCYLCPKKYSVTRALFFSLFVTWAPGLPQEVSPSAASTPSMLSWVSCSWDNIQLSAKDWSKLVGT